MRRSNNAPVWVAAALCWFGAFGFGLVDLALLVKSGGPAAAANDARRARAEQDFQATLAREGLSYGTNRLGGLALTVSVGDGWFDLGHGDRRALAERLVLYWQQSCGRVGIPPGEIPSLMIQVPNGEVVASWQRGTGLEVKR
jgi:hypothetical protein